MLKHVNLSLPLEPIRVDVLYWKLNEGCREKYNIKNFCAGIFDIVDECDKSKKHLLGGYWTPENEYHNLIKIACHGCFGNCINADARDSNCQTDRKLAIGKTKKMIQKVFPGAIDVEAGPAIEETCIYSVSILFKNKFIQWSTLFCPYRRIPLYKCSPR